MPTSPLLEVKALSASIGGQTILKDTDLTVAEGDWLGLVGGSGTGKSTLLRIIMGLRQPAVPVAGTIAFGGVRYDCASPFPRPDCIAFVPQSPAFGLDSLRRMRWQWQQLLRIKGRKMSEDHRELFAALSLPSPDDRFPHQWSRGMQQRFLLAMALMESPRIVILDEPTSALDPVVAAEVLAEVQRLAANRGFTTIMVTHDLGMAARFARNLAIMADGRVVEQGPTDRMLTSADHDFTRELVAHRKWRTAPFKGWRRLC